MKRHFLGNKNSCGVAFLGDICFSSKGLGELDSLMATNQVAFKLSFSEQLT